MIKKVMIMPGGQYQVSLIQKARHRGYHVICTDRNPECPGSLEAHEFYKASLDDIDLLKMIVDYTKPSVILTDQTDSAVEIVAYLSEYANLKGIGKSCAELFRQKNLMREFSSLYGFPTPKFRICADGNEAFTAANEIGFPLIIKPLDSQSSKGVYRIDDKDKLLEKFPFAMEQSSSGKILVEQFIDGIEFTAEGFMSLIGHKTLAISVKTHYKHSETIANSLLYINKSENYNFKELRRINDTWVNYSKLPFGMTHAEYILSDGMFYLVEIAARGGGTRISSDIVPWLSNISYQDLLLDVAVEGKGDLIFDFDYSDLPQKTGLLEFFDIRPGTISSISGIKEAKNMLGVRDIFFPYSIGETIPPIINDVSRSGYFILLGKTESDICSLRKAISETIFIEVQ